jgi:hypothetical protein
MVPWLDDLLVHVFSSSQGEKPGPPCSSTFIRTSCSWSCLGSRP